MDILIVLNGLLTPLIAIIALYIACQQYQSNKKQGELKLQLEADNSEREKSRLNLEEYRLRLDLYNKRFRIFEETKKILHKIVQEAGIDSIELRDFMFSINESKFLFDSDIIQFLDELKTNAIKLKHAEANIKDLNQYPVGTEKREAKIEEDRELSFWFNTEYENIEYKFDKYLNFKNL